MDFYLEVVVNQNGFGVTTVFEVGTGVLTGLICELLLRTLFGEENMATKITPFLLSAQSPDANIRTASQSPCIESCGVFTCWDNFGTYDECSW
ncbi:hypothetical protein IFM89_023685 [Coptis chinensis]|uniref:Uncharacterized protein n=1 Tax=Coptis chinensis TaxID=261450 RepID=A0A835GXS9_9MAGN|nr:hypothetical protein IFM89_023685 [Coptis chinensis]